MPDESHPGTPILHTEQFATPDGLGAFFPIEHKDPAELPDEEYPFILTTVVYCSITTQDQ